MVAEKNLILDEKRLKQIIKRIAYQVFEENYKEKEIYIAGVFDNGYTFAQLLVEELKAFKDWTVKLIRVDVDKVAKVQPEIKLDISTDKLKGKTVVVTDDVLNTGRALIFSIQPFLTIPLAKLQTAVIVKRTHKTFPVSTDFVGYSMATTLKEHVEVNFTKKEFGVYLH